MTISLLARAATFIFSTHLLDSIKTHTDYQINESFTKDKLMLKLTTLTFMIQGTKQPSREIRAEAKVSEGGTYGNASSNLLSIFLDCTCEIPFLCSCLNLSNYHRFQILVYMTISNKLSWYASNDLFDNVMSQTVCKAMTRRSNTWRGKDVGFYQLLVRLTQIVASWQPGQREIW